MLAEAAACALTRPRRRLMRRENAYQIAAISNLSCTIIPYRSISDRLGKTLSLNRRGHCTIRISAANLAKLKIESSTGIAMIVAALLEE